MQQNNSHYVNKTENKTNFLSMKRLVFLATFMALFGTAFSQEEIKTDTTLIINDNKIQIIDSSEGLKIEVYSIDDEGYTPINPYYEVRYETEFSKSADDGKGVVVKFPLVPDYVINESDIRVMEKHLSNEAESDKQITKSFRIKTFDAIFPSLYFSYSQLADAPFQFSSSVFQQRPISFEWGSYIFGVKMCSNRSNTLGLTAGLGISNTYNYMNNNTVLADDNGNPYIYDLEKAGQVVPEGMEGLTSVSKSFVRYWSMRLPVNVQVQWRVGYNKMALSVGPELEWRFGMRSFARYYGAKHVVSKELNYKPLAVNALMLLSYDDIVLFGRFALTDMFGDALKAAPFNIGIGFNL